MLKMKKGIIAISLLLTGALLITPITNAISQNDVVKDVKPIKVEQSTKDNENNTTQTEEETTFAEVEDKTGMSKSEAEAILNKYIKEVEEADFTYTYQGDENTFEAIETMCKRVLRFLPGLKDLSVIRFFSGFRPYTPDGLPLLGEVSTLPGFYMAAGHEGDGIAMSPITGKLMAELIAEGKPSYNIDAFSPNRFLKGK